MKPEEKIFSIAITLLISLPIKSLSPYSSSSSSWPIAPPPLPILPIPSSRQLSWQLDELSIFIHFGLNTFTDSELGSGNVRPSLFNPLSLDASQWVSVAKDAGFSKIILTAKHHDGFCLWPSRYTDYSVKFSPWKNGGGDVVLDLSLAAMDAGIGLGLYLSPWDRHEFSYGRTVEYNEFYMGQMEELLSWYGEIKEVWLDGAKGEGEKDMVYFFDCWFSLIHQLQPEAVIFSDAGPDTRWVGDETGIASSTCWSLFNKSDVEIGHIDPLYSGEGDPFGRDWVPPECDVSIRTGWFWHKSEFPKSAPQLLDLFYKSVGRNCPLLLNVPPNSSGLIPESDIRVLTEFRLLRDSIFSTNLAENATVTASSIRGVNSTPRFHPHHVLEQDGRTYWAPGEGPPSGWCLFFDFHTSVVFNVLQLQEPVQMGQRIVRFRLDVMDRGGRWRPAAGASTVGYKRILRFPQVEASRVRLVVEGARAEPLISYFGIYFDRYYSLNLLNM